MEINKKLPKFNFTGKEVKTYTCCNISNKLKTLIFEYFDINHTIIKYDIWSDNVSYNSIRIEYVDSGTEITISKYVLSKLHIF